jgi:bifunctional DNase/RNase
MTVLGVTHQEESGRAVISLEAVGRALRLALLVPTNEANRLARALGQGPCGCVPVFDLVECLLTRFRASLIRAVLDAGETGISGCVYVRTEAGEDGLPCHPSDALALATRAGVPIFAAEGALRYACPIPGADARPLREWLEEADARTLHEWLEGVTPDDFRRLDPAPD